MGGEAIGGAREIVAAGEGEIVGVARVGGAGGVGQSCEAAVEPVSRQVGERG